MVIHNRCHNSFFIDCNNYQDTTAAKATLRGVQPESKFLSLHKKISDISR